MADIQFNSVAEMLDSFDEPSLADAAKERIASRKVISALVALRVANDLSQGDIASELGCTQSRISKLERGDDDELRWRDIKAYAHAVNRDLELSFMARDVSSLADQVKHHAFEIRDALSRMVQLAHKDTDIADGVAKFHIEALLNLVKLLHHSASGLPRPSNEKHPSVETTIVGDVGASEDPAAKDLRHEPGDAERNKEYAHC